MTRRPDPFLAAVRWLETWWLEQRATNRPRTADPMLDRTYSALAAVLVVAHRYPEFVTSDIEWPADLHDDDRAAVMEEAERRRWIARIGEVGRAGRQPVVLWASLVYTPAAMPRRNGHSHRKKHRARREARRRRSEGQTAAALFGRRDRWDDQ